MPDDGVKVYGGPDVEEAIRLWKFIRDLLDKGYKIRWIDPNGVDVGAGYTKEELAEIVKKSAL